MYGYGKFPNHLGYFSLICAGDSPASCSGMGASTWKTFSSSHFFWYRFSRSIRKSRLPVCGGGIRCLSEGDGEDGAHLGQFHGLRCRGGGHSSDSRETGDICTRERPGEERGPNDDRLISTVGRESDPRVCPLIFFSTRPIESTRVNKRAPFARALLIETTNRHKR
jgi:hypothetical protein